MKSSIRNALAAAGFVAASLASSVALAVPEIEATPGANDSFGTAQNLDDSVVGGTDLNGGTVQVTGAIGNTTYSVGAVSDVDFYSFSATGGDMVTIDIGNGIKDDPLNNPIRSVDTVIALFDSNGTLLNINDDAADLDANSLSTSDARIDNALIPGTGTYFVGVLSTGQSTDMARTFVDGGGIQGTSTMDSFTGNGSYTLVISGMHTPQTDPGTGTTGTGTTDPGTGTTTGTGTTGTGTTDPGTGTTTGTGTTGTGTTDPGTGTTGTGPVANGAQQINIDIRPRHPGVTRIWANATGKVAVALLSSSTFDPMKVDRMSITFGADGTEHSLVRCHSEGIYVNRDRRKDLVCLFDLKAAHFEMGDLEGVLRGTVNGMPFEGHAPLKVVQPGKKEKHRHHGWERRADRR